MPKINISDSKYGIFRIQRTAVLRHVTELQRSTKKYSYFNSQLRDYVNHYCEHPHITATYFVSFLDRKVLDDDALNQLITSLTVELKHEIQLMSENCGASNFNTFLDVFSFGIFMVSLLLNYKLDVDKAKEEWARMTLFIAAGALIGMMQYCKAQYCKTSSNVNDWDYIDTPLVRAVNVELLEEDEPEVLDFNGNPLR